MKPITKALVFFLAVIAPLVIVTLALRRPAEDKTRLNELRERYSKVHKPGVDHGKFAVLQQDFDNPHMITAACLSCHTERGHELLNSPHFTWEREDFIPGKGVVYIGKKNLINNFCTGVQSNEGSCMKCHAGYGWGDKSFDFSNPYNIDCIVCHDNTGTYQKASGMAGYPVMGGEKGPDFKAILASVGHPKSENCGSCHFFGGGGNNVKHGDLESALLTAGRQVDVHMGTDGVHMQCVDCHTAENHQMKGRYFGITATGSNRLNCEDCHTSTPHVRSILNEHTIKVSCQACHIPVYAKVNATKMAWDWSTATKKLDGKGFELKDEDGNTIYTSAKGDFKWEKNVKPEYAWFNGIADHLLTTDKIDTTVKVLKINRLFGEYKDKTSKIIPVKVHRGRQPYDPEYLYVLQAKMWDREAGQGALWLDLNWDSAIIKGMEYIGLPYSGKYAFIDTEVYLPVNHMVSPSSETVSCKECHTRSQEGRLAQLQDFYMPGRNRNSTADMAGRMMLILSFAGVAAHAGIRFFSARKNKTMHLKQAMKKSKKIYIYKGFERFWHWNQSLLIFILAITGFEIHSSYNLLGYDTAVDIHNKAALGFIVLIIFAIFWHFTTGEWKQYLPTTKNLKAQLDFYLFGIFRNSPHPTKKTLLSKLNPLQRLVYLGLKVLIIPVMVTTGLAYMFYRYPQGDKIEATNIQNLEMVAVLHTFGAFVLLSFVVVHLYLITTGHTLTSNLKAMITGWEELEEEDKDDNEKPLVEEAK